MCVHTVWVSTRLAVGIGSLLPFGCCKLHCPKHLLQAVVCVPVFNSWGIYLGAELLGHVITVSLIFGGTPAKLFSTVTVIFCGTYFSGQDGVPAGPDWMASVGHAYPLLPSVDRVAPRKARLPAQPARQPLGEEPQHGALSRCTVPGHGNYLCVSVTVWPGALLCEPVVPLPGASRTGRASGLPRSRYPIAQLLPSLWLSPAPGGHVGAHPVREGAGPGAQTPAREAGG